MQNCWDVYYIFFDLYDRNQGITYNYWNNQCYPFDLIIGLGIQDISA